MDDLICPITREVFRHPVVASDGWTYEKCALECWLKRSNESPITRERLNGRLIVNRVVKNLVENIKSKDKHPENCFECSDVDQKYLDIKNWHYMMFPELSENQLKILIDNMDLESVTNEGLRPIHYICRFSTPDMIRYIIDKGVDLESAQNDGWRPIHLICRCSTPEMIRYIIDKEVHLDIDVEVNNKRYSLVNLIVMNKQLLDLEKAKLAWKILRVQFARCIHPLVRRIFWFI